MSGCGGTGLTGKSYVMQYAHVVTSYRNLVKVWLKIPAEKWVSEPIEDIVGEKSTKQIQRYPSPDN